MIDKVEPEKHEGVIHDLHVVREHQRPDGRRQESQAQRVAPFQKGVREKNDEGKITECHKLRTVPFAGKSHHVRAEHKRQRGKQRCGTGKIPDPHKEEHEHAAHETVDDKPGPCTVQIEKVENGLHIAHVVREIGDIAERRHAAEKIRHPDSVNPFRFLDLVSGVCVTEGRGSVALGGKRGVVEDDPAEDNQRHRVQQSDAEEVKRQRGKR